MYDETRLRQLIHEARERREAAQQTRVDEFRTALEGAITPEVSRIVGMEFSGDYPENTNAPMAYTPRAEFTAMNLRWTITRNWQDDVTAPVWAMKGKSEGGATKFTRGFSTKDELLLLLDELTTGGLGI